MDTKESIYHAAAEIIAEDGVTNITLEKVAGRAGISKGGLLYHFPNKDALIKGLVEYNEEVFEDQMEGQLQKEMDLSEDKKIKGLLKAYIDVTFNEESLLQESSKGLLAAALLNPDYLEPIKERTKRLEGKIKENASDYISASIIRLAVDGFWLSELLGINFMEEKEKEKIKEVLARWSEELDKEG